MWRLGRRPQLDGLRGVAILLVMLAHLSVPGFASGGHAGVTLFFVLSGFLITSLLREEYSLNGHRIDLVGFYRRRALRLLPALFVVITVFSALQFSQGDANLVRNAGAAAFYAANWFRAFGTQLGDLSHTWSLSIEEQFYLAWPAAMILCRNRRRLLMTIAASGAITAVALRVLLWHGESSVNRVQFGTDTRMDGLLAGCLLAFLIATFPEVRLPRGAFWVGAAILAACTINGNDHFSFVVLPGLVAVAGMLLTGGSLASSAGSFLKWAPLRYTGRTSYGLYLWHVPLFGHLHQPLLVRVPLGFAAAYLIAGLSFRFIETPFLRRKHRPIPAGAARQQETSPALI